MKFESAITITLNEETYYKILQNKRCWKAL